MNRCLYLTYLNQTPRLEWCMVGCDSKNGYSKKLYSKEIALRAQYLVIILSSMLNITMRGAIQLLRERVHLMFIFVPYFVRIMATCWTCIC